MKLDFKKIVVITVCCFIAFGTCVIQKMLCVCSPEGKGEGV